MTHDKRLEEIREEHAFAKDYEGDGEEVLMASDYESGYFPPRPEREAAERYDQYINNVTSDLGYTLSVIEKQQRMLDRAREAIRDILANVALDWYVSQFAKDTTPQSTASTGIAAKIHNQELVYRIRQTLQEARACLTDLERMKEGEDG